MILSMFFMNTLLVLEKPFVFHGDCGWSLKNLNDGIIRSHQGAVSIRKTVLPGMAIPMLKIRRPNGRLIFNMEIAIRR